MCISLFFRCYLQTKYLCFNFYKFVLKIYIYLYFLQPNSLLIEMSTEQKPKRIRRSKKQMNKECEEYACPCGKLYYSYTALYTHIKKDHNNEAPGPIKRPLKNSQRIIGAHKIDQHNKIINIKSGHNPLKHISQFLNQYKSDEQCQAKVHQFYETNQAVQLILNPQWCKYKKKKNSEEQPEINITKGIQMMIQECKSYKTSNEQLELLLVVSAILIKYIINQTEDPTVIKKGRINLLLEYANYYLITTYDSDMKKYQKSIGSGWLGNKINFMKVLSIIFQWMLFKQITLTIVEFNQNYLNKYNTQSQIQDFKRKPQYSLEALEQIVNSESQNQQANKK